jgi:hypothetical protein
MVQQKQGSFQATNAAGEKTKVAHAAEIMPAHKWWSANGHSTPLLQLFGQHYLGHPRSSSGVERMFSLRSAIHSAKRNRLGKKKCDDLLKVYANGKNIRAAAEWDVIDAVFEWAEWEA